MGRTLIGVTTIGHELHNSIAKCYTLYIGTWNVTALVLRL